MLSDMIWCVVRLDFWMKLLFILNWKWFWQDAGIDVEEERQDGPGQGATQGDL